MHPARRTLSEIIRKKRRVAGSEAQRKSYPTFWYVLFKLLPPVRNFSHVFSARRGPVRPMDRFMLYFIHWAGRIAEAQEFLFVRRGWKRPNRS